MVILHSIFFHLEIDFSFIKSVGLTSNRVMKYISFYLLTAWTTVSSKLHRKGRKRNAFGMKLFDKKFKHAPFAVHVPLESSRKFYKNYGLVCVFVYIK